MELGITDPVPALKAPAVSHQLQHGFWGGAQAGEEVVCCLERLAVTATGGAHLHDPAGAAPCLADVLWSLFCSQSPGDVSAVADLVFRCHKRDVALSLELAADLTMQSLLVRFHGQEEVGPLLLELSKNGCWVCNASAWINLIICFSKRWDEHLFDDIPGTDACLIIHDVDDFCERFHSAAELALPQWAGIDAAVVYGGKSNLGAVFSKPLQFIVQHEWRFAWRPHTPVKKLAPVLLTIGSISDIAEIVERPNCAAPRS